MLRTAIAFVRSEVPALKSSRERTWENRLPWSRASLSCCTQLSKISFWHFHRICFPESCWNGYMRKVHLTHHITILTAKTIMTSCWKCLICVIRPKLRMDSREKRRRSYSIRSDLLWCGSWLTKSTKTACRITRSDPLSCVSLLILYCRPQQAVKFLEKDTLSGVGKKTGKNNIRRDYHATTITGNRQLRK